jgi:hypothetical protein
MSVEAASTCKSSWAEPGPATEAAALRRLAAEGEWALVEQMICTRGLVTGAGRPDGAAM